MTPSQELILLRACLMALGGSWFSLLFAGLTMRKEYTKLATKYVTHYERVQYLLDALEKKGVDLDEILDEFDLIALKNLERDV